MDHGPDSDMHGYNLQINSQVLSSQMTYLQSSTEASDDSFVAPELAVSGWSYAIEPVGITKDNSLTKPGLMEQINTTADASDFLWYSTRYCTYIICINVKRNLAV